MLASSTTERGQSHSYSLCIPKSPDRSADNATGSPSTPLSAIFLTSSVSGWNLVQRASMKKTPCSFAAARRDRSSAVFNVTGFSQSTCFFALIPSKEFS